jgi:hypothetical protein
MVAALVAVCELVDFAVEGVGYIGVAATTPPSIDFEDDIVAYPSATGTTGLPPDGSPFPVVLVANVFFEVDTVVDALSRVKEFNVSLSCPR